MASKLEDAIKDVAPRTRATYQQAVREFEAFAGSSPWTTRKANEWCEQLLKDGARRGTIVTKVAALRMAAANLGQTFAADVVIPEAAQDGRKRVLSDVQLKALLNTCNSGTAIDLRDKLIILLMTVVGMDRYEVSQFRVGKGIEATAMWPRDVQKAFARWAAWMTEHATWGYNDFVFRALARPRSNGTIRVGTTAFDPHVIYHVVRRRAKAAGIRNVNPRALRQTYTANNE